MSSSLHANRSAAIDLVRPLLAEPAVAALLALPARFEAHLVGGVLRDRLLGGRPHDVDAVVAGHGEAAAAQLAGALGVGWFRLGGDRFAAYRLEGEGFRLDVWDRQKMTVEADLRRRDLTVNSIALRVGDLEIVDPFGGLEDLDRRRLRATSDTSFSEDPLRVLRLVRFASQLRGFAPTESTVELARRATGALSSVARERIREELRSVFAGDRPDKALALSVRVELYPKLWSGDTTTEIANAPPTDRLRRLTHRAAELAALPAPERIDAFLASQAVLFAELPEGATRLAALHEQGLLANRDARDIARLLEWNHLPATDPERRWLLHRAGELWPSLASFLGSAAGDDEWRRALRALARLAGTEADAIFAPPPLMDGNQIASLLGLEPGPELGAAVRALRRAQIEGRVASAAAAADFLRDLASRAG